MHEDHVKWSFSLLETTLNIFYFLECSQQIFPISLRREKLKPTTQSALTKINLLNGVMIDAMSLRVWKSPSLWSLKSSWFYEFGMNRTKVELCTNFVPNEIKNSISIHILKNMPSMENWKGDHGKLKLQIHHGDNILFLFFFEKLGWSKYSSHNMATINLQPM